MLRTNQKQKNLKLLAHLFRQHVGRIVSIFHERRLSNFVTLLTSFFGNTGWKSLYVFGPSIPGTAFEQSRFYRECYVSFLNWCLLCREKERGSKCCIEMQGALTQISDPDAPGTVLLRVFGMFAQKCTSDPTTISV